MTHRMQALRLVGAGLWLMGCVLGASAQEKTRASDLQSACQLSGIPALEQLSVTWTGECSDAQASGVGNVIAFSRGELRYILRGQFSAGSLMRQDQFTACAAGSCDDQIAPAVVRLHATASRKPQAAGSAGAGPAATVGASASSSAVTPKANPTTVARADIRASDAVYKGSFTVDPKSGAVSGEGRVEFFDGRLFVGRLEDGRKTGQGAYTWADGQKYVGQWKDDLQEGAGEWTSAIGDRYVGDFKAGRRDGKGVMDYANKSTYSGDWAADLPHGKGKLRFSNGDVHEGDFREGQRTGAGTLTQQNGDRYSGQWVRGERDGKGLAEWKNGQQYEGEWRKDRKEGQGRMRFPDGNSYEGSWEADQATGQGVLKFASGDTYTGEVREGQAQGKGVYVWGSGDRFEGEFDKGKPTTQGLMTFQMDGPGAKADAVATSPAPAEQVAPGAGSVTPAQSKANLCSKAYNAARSVTALRKFIEAYPDDECGRHALARQKISALEENERKAAKEHEDRTAQAKALIGLPAAFRLEHAHCVSGSGSNCQRVVYVFEVRGKIRDIDLGRQSAQVQVTEVILLGNEKAAPAPLFADGRNAALDVVRGRMLGAQVWKTKTELGLAF